MKNYVGIDIGGTKMYMLYTSADNKRVEKQVPTGKDATVGYIRNEIKTFIDSLDKKPDAVGIAAPGLVENNTIVISDVLPNFSNVHGADLVPEYECSIINDVRAATVFETSKMNHTDTAIVVMVGTGIACGLFSNGRIIAGGSGFAGELGNCKIYAGEGNLQTLDEVSSGAAILKKANLPVEEIVKRLELGDAVISDIIHHSAYHLGIAISNLISVFNPNQVIFGGSTITYKGYFSHMLATIEACTLPELLQGCDIRITSNLKNIVALGAIANIATIQ